VHAGLALDAPDARKYAKAVSSTSFAVDLQDIHFVLFDQLEMDRKLGRHGKYADLDRDVVVIGVRDRLEIWNPTRWREFQAAALQDFSDLDEDDPGA